jgi:hypothetical protein
MDRNRKKKVIRIAAAGVVGALGALGFALFGMLDHGPSGPPQNDMTIDATMRNQVIESVIANLNRSYVFPEKAAAMEKQLRAQMQHGDYDSVTSADKLADTLTDALRRDTHDKHLDVLYFEKAIPESTDPDGSPEEKAAELLQQQRLNFGFESVGRFRGDIGYIDLHAFARPQHTGERIAAAMSLLSDTQALIIDLRKCGGGDPETVMLFASYLFDKPAHLNDVYWRDENRTEERWTQETVPGKKYGEARKVYLLTSSDTFSGCEDFAYALKNIRRATLVGETTGGGAHAGSPHRLNAHFMMFVPSGLPINPVTHTDWEGVGVTPDIKASAKNALVVAQSAALKDLIAVETDPDWKKRLEHTLADL